MEGLHQISPLDLEGDKAENWRKYEIAWENYAGAIGLDEKEEIQKVRTFLHVVGGEANEEYKEFTWDAAGDDKKLDKVLEKFKNFCNDDVEVNITIVRHKFLTYDREEPGPDETLVKSVDTFLKTLRTLVRPCKYGTLRDEMVKDRIVAGINNTNLTKRMLAKPKLDLATAISMSKARALSECAAKNLNKDENPHVNSIHKRQKYHKKFHHKKNYDHGSSCNRCGYKHKPKQCPAYQKQCKKCGKYNHFAKVCRSGKKVDRIDFDDASSTSSRSSRNSRGSGRFYIRAVTSKNDKTSDWNQNVYIGDHAMKMKIDSGAECNVISAELYNKVKKPGQKMMKSKCRLSSFTGETVIPVGEDKLQCTIGKTRHKFLFQIIDANVPVAILGKDACLKAKLISRQVYQVKASNNILDQFPEVFEGLGELEGEVHITVDESVQPVIHAPRRVPYAIRGKVEDELKRMIEQKIIEKVPENEPSDWVNSQVNVAKPNGAIRCCLDPRDLNQAIKREHHPMPVLEDATSRVNGAQWFSTLDAAHAYHQMKLDKESSKLVTFNTHIGRMRYLRVPMGINTAGDKFQRKMKDAFEGMPGVEIMMDDILVYGTTEQEHDERLLAVLERIKKIGLKLNKSKCKIKQRELKYLGFIFSKDGLKMDKDRLKGINDMPTPTSKEEIRRFMGMVNFVNRFIPNMSDLSAPMRELLHDDVVFNWEQPQEDSFNKLKSALCSAPVLAYYDPAKELTLQVDASSTGVGAALLQEGRPLAFASKALTSTQQQYAQIEKECYAILFGAEKFSEYVTARDTLVQSDHKPLESIMKKPIMKAPPRLQRMMVQLQRFPGLKVHYVKGKDLVFADTLSRAFDEKNTSPEPVQKFEVAAVQFFEALPVSTSKLDVIRKATSKDTGLQQLKEYVVQGWPEERNDVRDDCKPFFNDRDEMTVMNGILFKGQRIIIPREMRPEMMKKLHESHMGIVKTKQRARDIMYWPGISSDIEEMIGHCETCKTFQKSNQAEPLKSHHIPDRAWCKVSADLFEFGGQTYILGVDYYSKYPVVRELTRQTTKEVVKVMKSWFSEQGTPETLMTDNGPCFNSREFKIFANDWEFTHITSSPRYAKSNGQIERTVQTVKNFMKKCRDWEKALLEYRNTPLDGVGYSPAQLLMSRRTSSFLPVAPSLLMPEAHRSVQPELKKRQMTQKYYHDRHGTKSLPHIEEGEAARMRNGKVWDPVMVRQRLDDRSYLVESPKGHTFRRNRQHLLQTHEAPFQIKPEVDAHIEDFEEPVPQTPTTAHRETVRDIPSTPKSSQPRPRTARVPKPSKPAPPSASTPITTNSGRVVRPPTRLDM